MINVVKTDLANDFLILFETLSMLHPSIYSIKIFNEWKWM